VFRTFVQEQLNEKDFREHASQVCAYKITCVFLEIYSKLCNSKTGLFSIIITYFGLMGRCLTIWTGRCTGQDNWHTEQLSVQNFCTSRLTRTVFIFEVPTPGGSKFLRPACREIDRLIN
jgi:hypothetical protein